MYCKLYIHCDSCESVVSVLEEVFGPSEKEVVSTYTFKDFEIHLSKNDEADINKLHIYPDGFLFYEIVGDVDISRDHVRITDRLLRALWQGKMPTVASCDYEEELNRFVMNRRDATGKTRDMK